MKLIKCPGTGRVCIKAVPGINRWFFLTGNIRVKPGQEIGVKSREIGKYS